jgi:hypothetical protein
MRFPRFIRVRDDKDCDDCTTSEDVYDLYCNQSNIEGKKGNLLIFVLNFIIFIIGKLLKPSSISKMKKEILMEDDGLDYRDDDGDDDQIISEEGEEVEDEDVDL